MTTSDPDVARLLEMAASADPEEVDRAQQLAVAGMRADPRLQVIAAQAFDRARVLAGRPQKFGTQAVTEDGRRVPWPIDPGTTDSERAKWGIAALPRLVDGLDEAPLVDKATLRLVLRRRRQQLSEHQRAAAALDVCARGLEPLAARCAGAVVAAYWPIGGELDPRPLAQQLRASCGARLALPVVVEDELTFCPWEGDEDLQPAGFGALGPSLALGQVRPDVVLAPLVGCDRRGGRLGQGKGFYDKVVARLGDVFFVGVAFDCQVLPAIPTDALDRRLDAVLTDREWIALSG